MISFSLLQIASSQQNQKMAHLKMMETKTNGKTIQNRFEGAHRATEKQVENISKTKLLCSRFELVFLLINSPSLEKLPSNKGQGGL